MNGGYQDILRNTNLIGKLQGNGININPNPLSDESIFNLSSKQSNLINLNNMISVDKESNLNIKSDIILKGSIKNEKLSIENEQIKMDNVPIITKEYIKTPNEFYISDNWRFKIVNNNLEIHKKQDNNWVIKQIIS